MNILIVFLLLNELPFQPLVKINEDNTTATGEYLVKPVSAVFWDGDIYIADKNEFKIFVMRDNGDFTAFGKKGSGPGEFKNGPTHVGVSNGHLLVEQWNRYRFSIFDKQGKLLDEGRQDRSFATVGTLKVQTLLAAESIVQGYVYQNQDSGCYFSKLEDDDYLGVHLSRSILLDDNEGHLVVFKKSGIVEVFDQQCNRILKMPLALELMKAKVEESRLGTIVSQASGSGGIAYVNGTPIISAAVANMQRAWYLVKNENQPEQRWLYELDLKHQKLTMTKELDTPYDFVSYHEGVLVLVCSDEAVVSAYRLSEK